MSLFCYDAKVKDKKLSDNYDDDDDNVFIK